MPLRQRLHTGFKKLEEHSSKYLLPQEFYAVLLFFGIGIGALCFRGGRSLWDAVFSTDESAQYTQLTKERDSAFNMLSRNSASLRFWDSEGPDSSTKTADKKQAVEIAPASIGLNSASAQDLEKLPGIGEVMSRRILSYRSLRGKFNSIEELMNVSGIGAKKFEKMKPYLRLD